jgi:hypothetical protein
MKLTDRLNINRGENFGFERWWLQPYGFFMDINLFNSRLVLAWIGSFILVILMVCGG